MTKERLSLKVSMPRRTRLISDSVRKISGREMLFGSSIIASSQEKKNGEARRHNYLKTNVEKKNNSEKGVAKEIETTLIIRRAKVSFFFCFYY